MSIHSSEWIHLAKRVPVGQKRRFTHGAERSAALDVWNNEDSWSCYCHRCHEGGKVYKQVIQRVAEDAPIYRKYYNFKDTCSLDELAVKHKHKFNRLVLLLHAKGMSTVLIKPYNPRYNLVDDRLCFSFDGVHVGRDCTGNSAAKWLIYHHDSPKGYVYLQGSKRVKTCEPVVMTEDLFSAIKVKHYTQWSTLWLQGTRIDDECLRLFTECDSTDQLRSTQSTTHEQRTMYRVAVTCLDSDCAGFDGTRIITGRFNLYGLPIHNVRIPDGLDPKDLDHVELIEHFKHLEDL